MEVAKTDVDIGALSGLVELEAFHLSAPDSSERTWYQQSPDSLVDVAYMNPGRVGGTSPLSKRQTERQRPGLARGLTGLPLLVRRHLDPSSSPKNAAADTTVRDDSRIVLQAPLEKGASWTSFRDPFLSTRTVVGRTTVETQTRQFNVVEIVNTLPEIAPKLRWSDYIAEDGLIRRVVTDTLEGRDEDGMPIGQYLWREVYTLSELQN